MYEEEEESEDETPFRSRTLSRAPTATGTFGLRYDDESGLHKIDMAAEDQALKYVSSTAGAFIP